MRKRATYITTFKVEPITSKLLYKGKESIKTSTILKNYSESSHSNSLTNYASNTSFRKEIDYDQAVSGSITSWDTLNIVEVKIPSLGTNRRQ